MKLTPKIQITLLCVVIVVALGAVLVPIISQRANSAAQQSVQQNVDKDK